MNKEYKYNNVGDIFNNAIVGSALIVFVLITMTFLIRNKQKLRIFNVIKTKLLFVSLGILIISMRLIGDISTLNNLMYEDRSYFSIFTVNVVQYVIGLWLITSRINRFNLIAPIGIYSIFANGDIFNGGLSELTLTYILATTIVIASIISNPKWTIHKIMASFTVTSLFVIAPSVLVVAQTHSIVGILDANSIYSIGLMIFSLAYIISNRIIWHLRHEKSVSLYFSIKSEILLIFKSNLKTTILNVYKEILNPTVQPTKYIESNNDNIINLKERQFFIELEYFEVDAGIFAIKSRKSLNNIRPRSPSSFMWT